MTKASALSWDIFRQAGLLWFVNRSLHIFGWAIVAVVDDKTGMVQDVYPARVGFRGFQIEAEEAGFERLTAHMAQEMPRLVDEVFAPNIDGTSPAVPKPVFSTAVKS